MCRHTAWLGQPRTLAGLLLEQPSGLLQQSWAPRRQAHGTVNADGWGTAWWSAARAEPARWRSPGPVWSDASLASVAPHVSAGCVLAAVRDATTGMPADETACAPFVRGRWALSHNGVVDRAVLPARAWPAAESVCDSAVLAAWLLAAPEEIGPRVRDVAAADPGARLNVLAADGSRLVATAWGDTLSVLRTAEGVVVASEPHDDDPRWEDVPDRSLVEVDAAGVRVSPLG
ncbi:ergothioneine biosynthesis protein EgtC [Kineococcus rhizosphaerae]|uniref:Gamma-glutamyl-hercynylcysteine sulfoxide hydrolase n=1 Tax=Kineococcus rhizosphaerae TaxID=559628 RepID=A0A2T0R7G3_9ACTN|nr:ergothioneine biosynthesis protein EgtC [Kineococcus rhizosphaerae]PRY17083.1 glutamine amidotransferase [Kineococcus rhizosphaerae]